MSVTLSAPPYSFVQITEPERSTGCVDEFNLCLPVKTQGDLSFQLLAAVSGTDKNWFEVHFDGPPPAEQVPQQTLKYSIWGRVCEECGDLTGDEPDIPHLFSWTGTWRKIQSGSTDIWLGNFNHNGNETLFNSLPSGSCFHLCFNKVQVDLQDLTVITGVDTNTIACTDTCFQKIDDTCFTSWFTYSCRENSMGFYYVSDDPMDLGVIFANQVRLPCFLRDVQFPFEQKAYKKSNGDMVKLYARIDEDYELKVDWVYKSWHKRLIVLLSHDTVRIDNTNDGAVTNMYIVSEEKYEINWPEEPYQLAPAKTRVRRAAGINIVNSNCS